MERLITEPLLRMQAGDDRIGDVRGRGAMIAVELVRSGSATLYSVPVVGAIAVVVGLQLLPERPMEGIELRIGRLRPLLLGAALAVVVLIVGATVPSQGVPPFIYFRF